MSDAGDWKQKYRDSVRELEAEERRWRGLEQILRRLVNRLCAAGLGADPRIDSSLEAVAAANRRDAGPGELELLTAELGESIASVDRTRSRAMGAAAAGVRTVALAPVEAAAVRAGVGAATASVGERTRAAAAALLSHLAVALDGDSAVSALGAELTGAESDEAVAAVLLRAAELVGRRGDQIAAARAQSAAILEQIGARLDELSRYFEDSGAAVRTSLEATETLNADVAARVREIREESLAATDLRALRDLVDAGLGAVSRCVSEYREQEESRLSAQSQRAVQMQSRIVALENETRDLNRQLDAERQLARIDALTGVANRKAFDERLAQQLAGVRRSGQSALLLIWDIDHFKSINDRYGHRAGDLVLQTVAQSLQRTIRQSDFLARIGGEEFAVLMTHVDGASAPAIAEKLRAAVESIRFHFRGTPVPVTASCGFAEIGAGDGIESSFERADAALYRAKSAGRNRCEAA